MTSCTFLPSDLLRLWLLAEVWRCPTTAAEIGKRCQVGVLCCIGPNSATSLWAIFCTYLLSIPSTNCWPLTLFPTSPLSPSHSLGAIPVPVPPPPPVTPSPGGALPHLEVRIVDYRPIFLSLPGCVLHFFLVLITLTIYQYHQYTSKYIHLFHVCLIPIHKYLVLPSPSTTVEFVRWPTDYSLRLPLGWAENMAPSDRVWVDG